MKLAIIPARGGSKRIPRKNIKLFNGKPMLSYAVSAAKQSGLFDAIIVSSDDEEILAFAEKLHVISLHRPPELAEDHTPTIPVIAHAIKEFEKQGNLASLVCCIYPAVPFLQPQLLIDALDLLNEKKATYVFPVTHFATPIQRALHLNHDGKVSSLHPVYENVRTQDLAKAYHDAGQFYWGKKSAWVEGKAVHTYGYGIPIPPWSIVDIDTPDDWIRAELIYKVLDLKERESDASKF